jgi:hypothetical protein
VLTYASLAFSPSVLRSKNTLSISPKVLLCNCAQIEGEEGSKANKQEIEGKIRSQLHIYLLLILLLVRSWLLIYACLFMSPKVLLLSLANAFLSCLLSLAMQEIDACLFR